MSGADGFEDAFRFTNNGARVAKDGSGLKRSTYVPPPRPATVESRTQRRRRRRQKRQLQRVYRAHRPEKRWIARLKRIALILILVLGPLFFAYVLFIYK